jgi:hypothetical protein
MIKELNIHRSKRIMKRTFEEMEIMEATTADHMLNFMQNIKYYNPFRIRQRPAQTNIEDVITLVKGLQNFNEGLRRH